MLRPYIVTSSKGITFMFTLDRKLGPDEFIKTFYEANRQDHQRPPHPWEAIFREGKCTQ